MPSRRLLLLLLILVPLAAAGVLLASIDPNSYRPRIEAAVARATGRTLVLNGRLGLRLLPTPTLVAGDMALSNPPGFSRPEMLHADGLQARIALLPLLRGRLRITRLTLLRPDILLETDAAGDGNWHFAPEPSIAARPEAGASVPRPRGPSREAIEIRELRIEDGVLGWRDGGTGRGLALHVARLDAVAPAAGAPVDLTAQAVYREAPFSLAATLPPLHDLFSRAGGKLPAISAVRLHVGAAELGAYAPGLVLTRLDVSAPRLDQPVQAAFEGSYAGAPLNATITLGPAATLLPGATDGPLAIALSADAVGGTLSIRGQIARPARLSGADLAITARFPDLAALGPLLHRSLPGFKDLAFAGGLTDSGGSLHDGLTLAGATLSVPQGDLAGDVTIGFGETPSLRATLTSTRMDVGALHELLAWLTATPPSVATPVPIAAASRPQAAERVIPDRPLPFAALRRGEADIQFGAATLTQGRLIYHDVSLHLLLAGGHLRVQPISGQIAGSRVDGLLDVDLSRQPPPVSLALHAPALALEPLAAALGVPGEAAGILAVDADLRGAGETLHRIASRLDGTVGLSMVDGSVDNRLLEALLGDIVRSGQLPSGLLGKGGRSDVRCLAARLDASHGAVAVRAFLLDTNRFRATASGGIELGDEALALRVRPFVKVAGSGVVIPLRVGGTLADPAVEVDANGSRAAVAGDTLLSAADNGDCAPALSLARGGRPGPLPPPEKPAKGADLLRGLFR